MSCAHIIPVTTLYLTDSSRWEVQMVFRIPNRGDQCPIYIPNFQNNFSFCLVLCECGSTDYFRFVLSDSNDSDFVPITTFQKESDHPV